MRAIIINKQSSDMGYGEGKYEWDGILTLREGLFEIKNKLKAWGTITIITQAESIYRKFDYNTYGEEQQFYYHLDNFMLDTLIKSITFMYCNMNYNLEICLSHLT